MEQCSVCKRPFVPTDYKKIAKLGQGAFGSCSKYKRDDPRKHNCETNPRVIAVKKIERSSRDIKLVLRETEILTKINHENLVKMYHFDDSEDTKVIIYMELCLMDLQTYIKNVVCFLQNYMLELDVEFQNVY